MLLVQQFGTCWATLEDDPDFNIASFGHLLKMHLLLSAVFSAFKAIEILCKNALYTDTDIAVTVCNHITASEHRTMQIQTTLNAQIFMANSLNLWYISDSIFKCAANH